jgi:hypothetical protein
MPQATTAIMARPAIRIKEILKIQIAPSITIPLLTP